MFILIRKRIDFHGDLTDVSAKTATLKVTREIQLQINGSESHVGEAFVRRPTTKLLLSVQPDPVSVVSTQALQLNFVLQ